MASVFECCVGVGGSDRLLDGSGRRLCLIVGVVAAAAVVMATKTVAAVVLVAATVLPYIFCSPEAVTGDSGTFCVRQRWRQR